jgi:hypothetical protein
MRFTIEGPRHADSSDWCQITSGPPCSLGLSATSQQYFSLTTNQPLATSQQYFPLRTNQHQPPDTSQTNRTFLRGYDIWCRLDNAQDRPPRPVKSPCRPVLYVRALQLHRLYGCHLPIVGLALGSGHKRVRHAITSLAGCRYEIAASCSYSPSCVFFLDLASYVFQNG